MNNFLSCVLKDIKIFGRGKFSALISVIVPLLIVILLLGAFSSQKLEGVKVAVYAPQYGEVTESIIQGFEAQSFKVVKKDNIAGCIEGVKGGGEQICVVFPDQITSGSGSSEEIQFHVDPSRINVAYILIDQVKSKVSTASSGISLDLVNDMILDIQQAKKGLAEQRSSLKEAKDEVTSLSETTTGLKDSLPDTEALNNLLEDIKDLADDLNDSDSKAGSIKTKAVASLEELADIDESYASTSQNLEKASSSSALADQKLSAIDSNLNVIMNELSSLKVTEAERIVSPIRTKINSVVNEQKNSDYLFPTLLALMMMFGGTILAATMASREKRTRAYFRNFITPTSDFTFLMSMYVSCMIILTVQVIVLFAGLLFVTDFSVFDSFGGVSMILFLTASAFVFLGLFIGHFFRSEETVILSAISVVSMLMFFSNTIFPIETILGQYQQFALYNPLVIASSLLKRIMLLDASISSLASGMVLLGVAMGIFLVFAFAARKATKRFV